ncbi:alkene reductase [Pseudomonas sp. Marseille-Q1929]|uniref:alkene reductase n=1 Tax=Pseudomonas sp. Marseille-Q1929 TaxID=2730402 RepID=UPI001A8E2B97|nr:alkene reductase [Pseudomonas sp. Marseille-Q1929]MBO0494222.1 alkene reductase [Pseudomonas sp. Marseille-Q1929]
MSNLFQPYNLAGTALANRVVMAPMTRARALDDIPDEHTVLYYAQRASAGLIISEGAPISREGCGYLFNPGLYNDAQIQGWRRVTDAVHTQGGKIFAQLWHVGRVSHVSIQPDAGAPVSSVAVTAARSNAYAWVAQGQPGPVQASMPRALEADEVRRVTTDFVSAARRAMDAGFDGVELHGANGYLFEQFHNGALNTRTDEYGGSIANRQRFLLETLDALAAEIGSAQVGVRLSPFGRLFDMHPYAQEAEAWLSLAEALNTRSLAYVHLSDQLTIGAEAIPAGFATQWRQAYQGTLIAAGGFTRALAEAVLAKGDLDLVAFGRPFIANPDLVERMQHDWPLAEGDRATFYGIDGSPTRGYTDYPTASVTPARASQP